MEKYNPNQNYYFVDYSLWEKGHPEYIERMKKRDPSIRAIFTWGHSGNLGSALNRRRGDPASGASVVTLGCEVRLR